VFIDPPTTPSKSQAHTTFPPPINWSTKPKPSPANSFNTLQDHAEESTTPARRLVPEAVLIDLDHVDILQEVLRYLSKSAVPENLEHLLHHLGHSKPRQSQPRFQEDPCLDGHDPSAEVQDLTSAFSGISTSTNYQNAQSLASSVPGHRLVPRTVPPITGTSRQVSPQKKRYYVVLVGKSTGVYYDVW